MENQDLNKRIAYLEFVNDQLMTELAYVDHLMREVGFVNGLNTIKATAHEIKNQGLVEE